jgi:RNA polymerase sigma-70 factor (ECF subfamily)
MTEPDDQLVARTLRGDLGAFEALVQRHQAVVFRVAARIAGPADAEDVTQDTFLRAFHRLRRFRGEAPFRAWLLQIAHNTALNAAARRRPEPHESIESLAEASSSGDERTPAERLEESERRERLELKVRQLTPPHRVVVVLRDIEGLSYEEIAEVTGSPIGSVKGWLHRGRRELIEILRRNTYDWGLPE